MNKASQTLFSEHEVILTAIRALNDADIYIDKDNVRYEEIVKELLYFFKNYADKFHHYKEEQVLFPEMIKKNELLEDGALKEMLENHEDFRSVLKNAEILLKQHDFRGCSTLLHHYAEALLDHIAVENEEVFQMLDTLFTEEELEKIYFRFEDCDNELGMEEKLELEKRIGKLMLETDHNT